MAFCYECGSEVAPNDAFCPYCGISLSPIAVAETAANETAAVVKSSAPNVAAAPLQVAPDASETAETPTVSDVSSAAAEDELKLDDASKDALTAPSTQNDSSGEVAKPETPEAHAGYDDFSNIPMPAIIENFESFQNSSLNVGESAQTNADAGDDDFGLVEASPAREIGEAKPSAAGTEVESQDFVQKSEVVETGETAETSEPAISENAFAESPETVFAEIRTEEPDEFGATIPDISAGENRYQTGDITPAASAEFPATETEVEISSSAVRIVENVEVTAVESTPEDSISKPADDLESFEPQPASSVFDSVRIMEDGDSFGSADTAPTAADSAAADSAAESPVSATGDAAGNFSQTTPNIGASGDTDGKKAQKLKPLDEGTILNNRFEIIRKIGGGGMGAVYLASDNNLGGVLRAVKEMVQSYIEEAQQEKSIEDFRRESMILSTLDHVSIPTIYDYFFDEKESRFYLVMKYINGGDLSGRLRAAPEGRIDELTVTEWAIQIADVLDYLHNRPTTIVYRDLKPSNVMIDGNSGRIMLIDFGIARSVKKEEKGVTAVGTMGYAPPELFSGNVEPRSDIYSLGSTMFHLLTGADPQNNPLLIFDFQKNPRPRQINPQLSDQMERILMKAVEYSSTARFASALEMKQALAEHLENLKASRVTYGVKEVPQAVSLANQMVFCGFCGQKIVASDMFCAFCGSKQPMSQKGVHSEIYASNYQTARLVVLGTSDLESPMFNLEKDENFVGRRDPQSGIFPEVDLSKFDPQTKISRRHARIWRDGGNFLVEDLGSSNGTVIMPQVSDVIRLLPHQPHVLGNGDKIRVGDTTLHFVKG